MEIPFNKVQSSNSFRTFVPEVHEEYPCQPSGLTFSVEDAVNSVGYGKFQMLLTFLTGAGWIADAFEIIILSLIGDFVACDWPLRRWENAILTSVVFGGMMIGSYVFGKIADEYGRKKAIAACFSLLFIFGLSTAASPSFTWMVILRCCLGFAMGGVSQSFTLCGEYYPTKVRGKAMFCLCYFWSIGTVGVILLAWIVMETLDSWRILLVITSIPVLLAVISLKWYPESARYFLVSNQYERAVSLLERMASINGKHLPQGKLAEVSHCTNRGRVSDLLGKDCRRATLLFCFLWLAIAVTYYGITLMSPLLIQRGTFSGGESLNNSSSSSFSNDMHQIIPCVKYTQKNFVDLLWTTAAEIPGLIVFTFLIERCSRKVLLGTSCFLSGISMFLLMINTKYNVIILLILFFIRGTMVAVFQLMYVMTAEAFPTTLRATAVGVCSAFCRIGGLAVPYVAQVLFVHSPSAAISLLGCLILMAALAAAFLPIETKGMPLKDLH